MKKKEGGKERGERQEGRMRQHQVLKEEKTGYFLLHGVTFKVRKKKRREEREARKRIEKRKKEERVRKKGKESNKYDEMDTKVTDFSSFFLSFSALSLFIFFSLV